MPVVIPRPRFVGSHHSGHLAMFPGGAGYPCHRGEVIRVTELAGDPHEICQVEVAEPNDVNPRDRGNLIHVRHTFGRLDHRDHKGARIGFSNLLLRGARRVPIVGDTERRPPSACRRVMRKRHNLACLFCSSDHGDHYPVRPGVEGTGDKVVAVLRHSHHWCDTHPVARRALRLD